MDKILRVGDVKKILGIGTNKAYEIIRELNKELENKGYMVVSGRVPSKYFQERMGL